MSDLNGTMMSDVIHGPDISMAELTADANEPLPEHHRHSIEFVETDDHPPYERCVHCGRSAVIGRIDPYFDECPGREHSRSEQRADAAREDDDQEVLA